MVAATTRPVKPPAPVGRAYDDPKPRLFTGAERRAMRDAGILDKGERALLLGGVIHVERETLGLVPRPFTRDEYYSMAELGIIGYDERLQWGTDTGRQSRRSLRYSYWPAYLKGEQAYALKPR